MDFTKHFVLEWCHKHSYVTRMNPIEDLEREHGLVKLLLRILEKMVDRIEVEKNLSGDDVERIVLFIREFTDKCHHGKEEYILFPVIKENGIPEEVALVDLFIQEHQTSRGFVDNMASAIEMKDLSKFGKNAGDYIKLLDVHVDRENKELFSMVSKSISEEKMQEMESRFDDVEVNKIGPKRQRELHKILYDLKDIYAE